MPSLLSIDTGYLFHPEDELNFLASGSHPELFPHHLESFRRFQNDLQAGKTPLSLSLGETAAIPAVRQLAEQLSADYDQVLIIGIGGSALGAKAVLQFLRGPYLNLEAGTQPRIFILDNLDPLLAVKLEGLLDWRRTALVYVSKSGSTAETAANFVYFFDRYTQAGGDPGNLVVMCDPAENGINRIARSLKCRLFHIPRALPGRYSVLSSVGFLPAELAGINSQALLAGAGRVHNAIIELPPGKNPIFTLGSSLFELAQRGHSIHVLFNYSSLLTEFGLWFMQLWGESLGKKENRSGETVHVGTTPLACTGATDQHSLLQLFKEGPRDKVYGFTRVAAPPQDLALPAMFSTEKEFAYFAGHTMGEQLAFEQLATEISLVRSGSPCYRITLEEQSSSSLGALLYFYEALVVYSAELWQINPFDQPGVEEGKQITYALMGREDYQSQRPQFEAEVKRHEAGRRVVSI